MGPFCARQFTPVATRRFQQMESADHIGLDKILGAVNGAIDMRFGGEIDDSPWPMLRQQTIDQGPVTDVAMNKNMPCLTGKAGEIFQITGISELVEVDDGLVALCEPIQYKIRADKPSAAGYENHIYPLKTWPEG